MTDLSQQPDQQSQEPCKLLQLAKQIGIVAEMCAMASLKGKHHFFFRYSPHTGDHGQVDIDFHAGKWERERGSADASRRFYVTDISWINDALKFIEENNRVQ